MFNYVIVLLHGQSLNNQVTLFYLICESLSPQERDFKMVKIGDAGVNKREDAVRNLGIDTDFVPLVSVERSGSSSPNSTKAAAAATDSTLPKSNKSGLVAVLS